MSINYKQIGEVIRIARIRQKFTQEQLAEIVDVSVTHISNIETSRTKVGLCTLIRISNSLSIAADELFYGNIASCNITPYHRFYSLLANCSRGRTFLIIRLSKSRQRNFEKSTRIKTVMILNEFKKYTNLNTLAF